MLARCFRGCLSQFVSPPIHHDTHHVVLLDSMIIVMLKSDQDQEVEITPSTKRVALVTGASSGLGKDFALRLLAEGYAVYGAARRIERMRDIEAAGGVALTMDVTDDDTMIVAINRMISEQSRIDVLINNAGYGQMGAFGRRADTCRTSSTSGYSWNRCWSRAT